MGRGDGESNSASWQENFRNHAIDQEEATRCPECFSGAKGILLNPCDIETHGPHPWHEESEGAAVSSPQYDTALASKVSDSELNVYKERSEQLRQYFRDAFSENRDHPDPYLTAAQWQLVDEAFERAIPKAISLEPSAPNTEQIKPYSEQLYGLNTRVVPVHSHDLQVQIGDDWFDVDLLEQLADCVGHGGFGEGVISDNQQEETQLNTLQERGLAQQSARGHWNGTEALAKLLDV